MSKRVKTRSGDESDRRGIQSVEVSFVILAALAGSGRSLALKELGALAGMPPSKVHRYLASFIRTGLVRQDEATGHYDLGPMSLNIGLAALSRLSILDWCDTAAKSITRQTGLTSLVSIWGPHGPTVVRWQRASADFVTSLGLGSVLSLFNSATGRVFLAYLPAVMIKNHVAKEIMKDQTRGFTNNAASSELKQNIQIIKRDGFATVDGSVIPGLYAIAAPVLDIQGEAAAVITLIGTDRSIVSVGGEAQKVLCKECCAISASQYLN